MYCPTNTSVIGDGIFSGSGSSSYYFVSNDPRFRRLSAYPSRFFFLRFLETRLSFVIQVDCVFVKCGNFGHGLKLEMYLL